MRKIKGININNIGFLDIETAPKWRYFKDVPKDVRTEWFYKWKSHKEAPINPDKQSNENYKQNSFYEAYEAFYSDLWEKEAGLYAEFARIVCITWGYITEGGEFRYKSYYQENEKEILLEFTSDIDRFSNQKTRLCAHYGKGFDFPWIAKRCLIHRLDVPFLLDSVLVKPWENLNLDTHELWQFGHYRGGATLSAIGMAFGFPTPKDGIDGADVSKFYHEGKIDEIVRYCERDTITLANIFKAMRGEEPLVNVTKVLL